MRNLKRALSLVMAAAMLIGMMVVSASAATTYEDFTDKDEIVNTEAVNTMVSLGVINGKEDGSYYDPSGIVTRAEMAKLIAVSLYGGRDLLLGSGASATQFSDTKGHWAEPYIAYCANLGIINGKGDGTFGPNETVTGTAAAKMFLCALGYKADIEGLTGAGWDLNTDTLAMKAGLYDDMNITPSDGLNRDNTAQLVYNGVQAQEVEYRNLYGEFSDRVYPVENGSMLANRFGVVKVEGIVVANDVFGLGSSEGAVLPGKARFEQTNSYTASNGTVVPNGYDGTYTVDIPNDMVGQKVVIYVKFPNALSPNAINSTVVGQPILSNDNTVVESTARLKDPDAVKDALKGSGLSLVSGASSGNTVATKYSADGEAAGTATGITGTDWRAGLRQRFIDNDGDGKVEVIIQEQYDLTKVTTYNTKDETMTFAGVKGTIDFADVVGYEDVEKNDYVTLIKYDDIYYVAKAETVTGDVTAYNSGNQKITIDGTAYGRSWGDCKVSDLLTDFLPGTLSGLVDGEYTLYLDPFGNMLAYEEGRAAIGNYALVLASGASDDNSLRTLTGQVKLLLADGTKVTYDVDLAASAKKFSGCTETTNSAREIWMAETLDGDSHDGSFTKTPSGNGIKEMIVAYTVNDSGVVTLTDPKTVSKYDSKTGTGGSTSLSSNISNYTVNGSSVVANSNTIFFVKDSNNDYSVINGLSSVSSSSKAVDNTNATNSVVWHQESSANVGQAIFLKLSVAYTSNAKYVYISGDYSKIVEKGNDIYEYPVVFEDGTTGTIKSKSDSYAKKMVYEYTTDSDGYATCETNAKTVNSKVITYASQSSVAYANASNTGAGTGSNALANGIKVWNVEDTKAVYDTSLGLNDKVALVLNGDGAVKLAFVIETMNEMTSGVTLGWTATAGGSLDATDNLAPKLTGATIGTDKVRLTITNIGANQDVTVKVGSADAADYTGPVDIAAAGATAVKVTVSEAGFSDRVYDCTVTITAPGTGMTLALTSPADDDGDNDLDDSASPAIAVSVENGTEEVVLTGTKTADQTVTIGGTGKDLVVAGGTATAPTYTVDTSAKKTGGALDSFTLTVTEAGKDPVVYTVTITVASLTERTITITGITSANKGNYTVQVGGETITAEADGTYKTTKTGDVTVKHADYVANTHWKVDTTVTDGTAGGAAIKVGTIASADATTKTLALPTQVYKVTLDATGATDAADVTLGGSDLITVTPSGGGDDTYYIAADKTVSVTIAVAKAASPAAGEDFTVSTGGVVWELKSGSSPVSFSTADLTGASGNAEKSVTIGLANAQTAADFTITVADQ